MKQIQGTSYNIGDDIVGRITFGKKNLFGRSNDILVCKDSDKPAFRLFGYNYGENNILH